MGHNDLHLRIAGQHIAADHVGDGAGGLCEILLHGQRCLRHHLAVHGFRTVGMQDDHGLALVQEIKERVEFGCTQILPLHIGGQFDAVGLQRVEHIPCLCDGLLNIGQGQGGAEQEPSWMLALDAGSRLVAFSENRVTAPLLFSERLCHWLWRRQCQHRRLHAGLIHPLQMIRHIVLGQGESLVHQSALTLQSRHKLRGDDVAVHIHHTLRHGGCCNCRCNYHSPNSFHIHSIYFPLERRLGLRLLPSPSGRVREGALIP